MAEWIGKNTVEDVSERIKALSVSEGCLKKGFSKKTSNIPRLKQQRLSASDSLCETTRPSSSSSSRSSVRLRYTKENFRRSSESGAGYFLPQGLRAQHAAHRCAWSESDKCSPSSSGQFKRTTVSNNLSSSSSGSRMDSLGARTKESEGRRIPPNASGRQKFDFYMPLCEVQQQLKRGELIEGILRVNPRNYEDSYISAPDGQMDIYIGGLHDRNRALNGDIVAVQLNPPHLWKIVSDKVQDVDKLLLTNPSHEDQQPSKHCDSATISDTHSDVIDGSWAKWTDAAPLESDTVEILGVREILRQAGLSNNGQNHFLPVSNSWTVTPDELLDLSGLDVHDHEEEICDDDGCREHVGQIVAPDLLSEDDGSPFHSDNSVGSSELTRALEDTQFLVTQQNAGNNNVCDINFEPIGSWPGDIASGPSVQVCELPDSTAESLGKKKKKRRRRKRKNTNTKNQTDENVGPNSDNTESFLVNSDKNIDSVAESEKNNKFFVLQDAQKKGQLKAKKNSIEEIMKFPNWEKFVQKSGKVVSILEEKHPRVAIGHLKLMQDKNKNWALFSTTDHKLPRLCIPMTNCPKGFYERPNDFAKTLFIAKIVNWNEHSTFAEGSLFKTLGEAGEIEPETEGILLENDIDYAEFDERIMEELPLDCANWKIPHKELESRLDLRKHCIFTIDPKTARDLDDALSCRPTEDGFFEVAVHIADVTFFLQEDSILDRVARDRATSVYLVQKVVPMLPRVLCENLCSLHPGEDKLAFSVIWKMSSDGVIVEENMCRSIIHSCVKLSYEHAQDIIDNPDKTWSEAEMPKFYNGFGITEVEASILQLHKIATKLRARRFNEGALRLDQAKISFTLDPATGMPSGYSLYAYKDSNKLVEEFMLLANMAVAHKMYDFCKEKAFLRCHPPPQSKMIDDVVDMCNTIGIHLDISTAGTLQESLVRFSGDDLYSIARMTILTLLCAKPMKPAQYFCAGFATAPSDFHHYALNVPLYTHFTSPIRRYPDVIVHRMLAAALGIGTKPIASSHQLQKLAKHCNDKKYTAKKVHELSCDLFLAAFVQMSGPLEEKAVVIVTMDHSFDVLIMRMGAVKRIYIDKLDICKAVFTKEQGIPQLTLTWPSQNDQLITIFTVVDVILIAATDDPLRFNAILKPPSSN